MGKITYIKIAGRNYPMSFSLGASKKIMQRYGSAKKMSASLSSETDDTKKIDMVVWILSLLISQGCAYKNYFEKDVPAPEDAPIIDGKWVPVDQNVLEYAIDIAEIEEVTKKIEECISGGSKKNVEVKPGKNAKAT